MNREIGVGNIGNYYGGLLIRECEGKFQWGIENYDGVYWETIPESLYKEILAFKESEDE